MSSGVSERFLKHWVSVENKEPGYAVLVSGPWGCGKTHVVKKVLSRLGEGEALYVSLYGVTSIGDIEKAMARSLYPQSESQAAKFAKQGKNLLSALNVLGVNGDLISSSLTEIALMGLPRVLVFDDLERAEMDLRPLLGALNRYVEHEKKTVILIGAEDILRERHCTYDREKEKICGRTVFVEPDVETVLPALWGGHCLGVFQAHQADIVDVFQASDCQSLRVLNQTLREFALVLGELSKEPKIIEHKSGLRAFLRTYFALSLAYLSGNVAAEDISGRGSYDRLRDHEGKDEPTTLPLGRVADLHMMEGIYAVGSVISEHLGTQLFVEANSPNWMASELLESSFFATGTKDQDEPDWKILFGWRAIPSVEIEAALSRVEQEIVDKKIANTGDIFKTYLALTRMSEDGLYAKPVSKIYVEAIDYVKELSKINAIAPRDLSSGRGGEKGYDFSVESGYLHFGGYGASITDLNRPLVDALMKAQDEALTHNRPNFTRGICDLLIGTPEEVLDRLEGRSRSNWTRNAFLKFSDPNKIADAFIQAWKQKPRTCGMIVENLASRWQADPSIFELERDWALLWRASLLRKAHDVGGILGAQICAALHEELTLLDGDEDAAE